MPSHTWPGVVGVGVVGVVLVVGVGVVVGVTVDVVVPVKYKIYYLTNSQPQQAEDQVHL